VDGWNGAGDVLRVERGKAAEEELAAVTVALLCLLARRTQDGDRGRRTAGPVSSWRRWERMAAYRSPRSWQ
jgi:hypothetical protein